MPALPFSEKTSDLLLSIGQAYDMNDTRMDENLPDGERGDTLADFVHSCVVALRLGDESTPSDEREAYQALNDQFDEAATVLKLIGYTLSKSSAPINEEEILQVAQAALLNGFACSARLGKAHKELLSRFVENEISDLINGSDPGNPKEVSRAMRSASDQLFACQNALDYLSQRVQPSPRPAG